MSTGVKVYRYHVMVGNPPEEAPLRWGPQFTCIVYYAILYTTAGQPADHVATKYHLLLRGVWVAVKISAHNKATTKSAL